MDSTPPYCEVSYCGRQDPSDLDAARSPLEEEQSVTLPASVVAHGVLAPRHDMPDVTLADRSLTLQGTGLFEDEEIFFLLLILFDVRFERGTLNEALHWFPVTLLSAAIETQPADQEFLVGSQHGGP